MSFYSSSYGSLLDEEPTKTKSEKSGSVDKSKSEETKAESDSGKSKQ